MNIASPSISYESAHSDNIWCVTWCQSDLITGSLDGTMKFWSINNTKNAINLKYTSPAQKSGISSLTAVQDGSLAICCYQDSTIRLFDLIKKEEVAKIDPGLFEAFSLSLSPADDLLVSGNNRGEVNIWTMQSTHAKVATLQTNNKQILSTSFSIDGKLACAGIDGMINIFDMNTQNIIHKLDAHALPIRSIVFSPEGDLIYSASDDRHVNVYDMKAGNLINSFSHSGMAFSIDASSNNRHFAVGCADYTVSIWDLGLQKRLQCYSDIHKDQVWGISYDKSDHIGTRFASVGDDGLIQIYE